MDQKSGRPLADAASAVHDTFLLFAADGGLCVETAASACALVRPADDEGMVVLAWHVASKFFEVESGLTLASLCADAGVRNPWSCQTLRKQLEQERRLLERARYRIPRDHPIHVLAAKGTMSRKTLCALLWRDAWRMRAHHEWEHEKPETVVGLLRALGYPRVVH